MVSGQPGNGCMDPRHRHEHWCGFCGAVRVFSIIQCRVLTVVPPCQRCGERQWRDELDPVTLPDLGEG